MVSYAQVLLAGDLATSDLMLVRILSTKQATAFPFIGQLLHGFVSGSQRSALSISGAHADLFGICESIVSQCLLWATPATNPESFPPCLSSMPVMLRDFPRSLFEMSKWQVFKII